MSVEVIAATLDQQPVLANLLELYIHDFSEFHPVALAADGRFGYPPLPLYWQEPDRHPFLVFIEGCVAGFVLIKLGSEVSADQMVWDMAEFFIIRSHRRRGIGTEVASLVWCQFPGAWEVRVMESNLAAFHFWQRAIDRYTGQHTLSRLVPKGNAVCHLFSFRSTAGADGSAQ